MNDFAKALGVMAAVGVATRATRTMGQANKSPEEYAEQCAIDVATRRIKTQLEMWNKRRNHHGRFRK